MHRIHSFLMNGTSEFSMYLSNKTTYTLEKLFIPFGYFTTFKPIILNNWNPIYTKVSTDLLRGVITWKE